MELIGQSLASLVLVVIIGYIAMRQKIGEQQTHDKLRELWKKYTETKNISAAVAIFVGALVCALAIVYILPGVIIFGLAGALVYWQSKKL